jgi:hypothetical protein
MDVRDDFAALGSLILVPSSLRPAKFNFITAKEARIVVGDTVLFSNIETQGCSITS